MNPTMMTLQETFMLRNGVKIPKLGLGTWFIGDDDVAEAIQQATEIGYRHIDSAQAYQNERGVGEGIRASDIDREDLFVTTKLAAEIKSYDEAVASIDESLERIGLEYIDMMIIHSPKPWAEFQGDDHYFEGNREAWRALEEAYEAGKLKAIGLSNFEKEDVENILESCSVKPMVNQILAHVKNTPHELINYCKDNDILVEAYSPFGHGQLLDNAELESMANKYGVSVPQLCIRYCLELDLLPLPKTANPAHMKDNAAVDFEISDEDMDTLINLDPIEDYGDASVFPVYSK
jgi:diketogulonate reductase-like aldo/keto reductase